MTYKVPEPAVFELLKSLVSGQAVFDGAAPKNQTAPYIVFQEISDDMFGKNVLNRTAGVAGTVQSYQQVDCYHTDKASAKALGKLVEYTLDGYSGTVYHGNDSPQAHVIIGAISKQPGNIDLVDRTDEPLLFRNSAVYLITYNQ